MKTSWTPDKLIAFEDDLAQLFNDGKIKAPLHLAGGNERQLIKIFEDVGEGDWVCGSWRSHYHCLLKGVPPAQLRAAILDGRSIALCFPVHKVICSAIVGGIVPIALGLAWAAKRSNASHQVWCFLGDMSATTGIVHECKQYASGHGLPLNFIVEDNGLSVASDTMEVWGTDNSEIMTGYYKYSLSKPHVGTGTWVSM